MIRLKRYFKKLYEDSRLPFPLASKSNGKFEILRVKRFQSKMQKTNQILPANVEKNKFYLFIKQSHDYNF